MKVKKFILTFLMMMSIPILFGQTYVSDQGELATALNNGGEVVLGTSFMVEGSITVQSTSNVTLDLNGCAILASAEIYPITNLGTLTIKDSGSNGRIEGRGILNGTSTDYSAANLTIKNGTFISKSTGAGAAVFNRGTVVINGGEFYGQYVGIVNKSTGKVTMKNAYVECLSYCAIRNEGTLTYNDGVVVTGKVVYENGGNVTGKPTFSVAKIGDVAYVDFKQALTEAKNMTGDVTVEIYGEVEFVNGMELKDGNYSSMKFKGMFETAKMTVNQNAGGDYIEAHGKIVAFENLLLAKANPAWAGNAGHMGNYFSIQGGTATYTNCTFLNGACTSGGTATYTNCTFENSSGYGLWVYDDALVTVEGGVINSVKGIKVYSEDEKTVTSTLTVQNATFTENVTAKPAVAIAYAKSITLIGNTYNNLTVVIELDSGSDADCEGISFVAKDAEGNDISKTLHAIDRSKNDASCGVLMDGKIYTTVATAAAAAEVGNTITLLYDTEEKVELPAGVVLDYNNYKAPNVTIDLAGKLGTMYISEADSRTRIYGEITGMLSVKESVVVKLYSDETLLATTTLTKDEYLTSQTLGVNIVIAGDASSSWNTEWAVDPIAHIIPNKAVLYLDDEEMNTANVTLGTIDNLGEPYVWGALTGVKPSPAMIGTTGYATLQEAINAAVDDDVITLNEVLEENVTVSQAADVKITIDGNNNNYRGTITVDGKSAAYATASLTIKNFNFNAYSISKDAAINLGGNNNIRYTSNVTVENCKFTGNETNKNKAGIKSYTGGCKNLTITKCTATGMHSLAQLYTTEDVTVTDCRVTNSGSGISLGASSNVSISGCTMDVDKYGIRVDASAETTTWITDCEINAYIPVIARKATANYQFVFGGTNTMEQQNKDGVFCVVDGGNNGYEDGETTLDALTAPTGLVLVSLEDEGLSYEGVYGGHTHEAKIGETKYVTLQDALDAVEAGEQPTTIEIIRDITSDATVSQVENENIIIDGKGFYFSGTLYIEGNSRHTGVETLTIQNFKFVTKETTHDFISSNSTESAKRYAHNVTVKDCEFTAPEDNEGVVGMRFRQSYNIDVVDSKFSNMFLGMWATGVSRINIEKIIATGCKEGGFSFGPSTNVTVKNSTIVATTGYGIRVDASVETTLTLQNSNITAKVPVVARNASANYNITFDGENQITELNSNYDYFCVIGTSEYDGGNDMPSAATGKVVVNLKDEALSYDGVYGNFAVAKIGNVQYSTFAEALEAVQNNDTIELINADTHTLDESNTELSFEKDIEFTITGSASEYVLPIVTFQRATVNIDNATFKIPELDARQNATINIKNKSVIYSATDDPIVKSYYNGRIIIDSSTVYTHQATTMGYIDIVNGGELNVTWQTNVYGNGLITVNGEGSKLRTAAFNLTAKEYNGRDNTDEDRIGKPAQVTVDGATLIAGNVDAANGADYSYETEKYGINIGTIADKDALLDIKNGSMLEFYMNPSTNDTYKQPIVGANGTVNIDASTFKVISRKEGAELSLDNTGIINVSDASVLNAVVTGNGNVNMTDVTLTEATTLKAESNDFNFEGENNINGATIEAANATVVEGKLAINENSDVKFNALTVEKQLSVSKGKLRVTKDFVNNGIANFNYEQSDVYVYGTTTNNSVLNISNKAKYRTSTFVHNSENLNVSANSKLTIAGTATFNTASVSKIAGEVSVTTAVTQAENAVIRLTDANAKFATVNAELNVVTTVADSKVVYTETDAAYVVVAKQYLASIGDNNYETLQDAFDAAENNDTIVLFNDNVEVVPMNAALYGKNVTITTNGNEVAVDWYNNGSWLFVGRGGKGDATLTFDNANLKAVSNNSGIHVSGREAETTTKYDGTLIVKNSNIQLTEFINRNVVTVVNSTITTTLLTSHGRPASEAGTEVDATATFTLTNSTLYAKKITNANEGFGIMNVDENSEVKVSELLTVKAKGTLTSAGNITGTIEKEKNGTIQLSGGIYTTEPQEGWCAENYGAFPYDETSWIVREVYGEQAIALHAGWNWMSSYVVKFNGSEGLGLLQNQLIDNGVQIKNQFASNTYLGGEYGWFGELEETSVLQMYMVNVSEKCEVKFEGDYTVYENAVINLNHGWNWIGYPVNEEINLTDALSNLEASNSDVIKTQGASAVYLNGRWISSTLKSLKPGLGYMYKNNDEGKSFVYSTKVTSTPSKSDDNRIENYWTADASQYSSNMTMIAMTDVEGGDYEVAAFVNGELRGSSHPVYVEELNSYILILTISGDEAAEVTFKYYDMATAEEVEFSNIINYSNDAIVGSIEEPYMLTRGTTSIDEALLSEINIYPNPTTTGREINLQATCDKVEVFNALGAKVAEYQNVDSIDAFETAGIYVIRLTNDGDVKHCRLVVK